VHPSGVLIGAIMVAVLIGMAFRQHYREAPLPWLFLACVVSWAVFHEFLVEGFGEEVLKKFMPRNVGRYSAEYSIFSMLLVRSAMVGPVVSSCIFVVAMSRRDGQQNVSRLAIALLLSTVTLTIGSVLLAFVPVNLYPDSVRFQSPWGSLASSSLEHRLLPNVHSAIGWIIWYVALFGGKPRPVDANS